jgi:hypothetical protein
VHERPEYEFDRLQEDVVFLTVFNVCSWLKRLMLGGKSV